ncbi:MAG: GerMN domain-containing protein [Pseudomonadota bacterium]
MGAERASHRIKKEKPRATPMVLAVLLIVAIATAIWLGRPARLNPPASPVYPPGTERVTIRLYFASADGLYLTPESRSVIRPPAVCDQMAEVVRELVAGPRDSGLIPVLPAGCPVRHVFLTEHGIACVDLGSEAAGSAGGAGSELLRVFSVVDTLERNFPRVKGVMLLLDGKEVPTLAGHVDLSSPLSPRADLISQGNPQGAPSARPVPTG